MSLRARIGRLAAARRDMGLVFAREVEARMATKGYVVGLLCTVAVIIAVGLGSFGGYSRGTGSGSGGHGPQAELLTASVLFVLAIGQIAVIAQGVVEEKSTRIVEVLMTTLTPLRLMTGKVAGIGVAALVQVLAMATALAVTEKLRPGHAVALPGPSELALSAGWFMLTFALFAFLAAAAGSLVSRSEDLQPVITPLVIAAAAPMGFAVAAAGHPTAPWVTVLGYVPPFSGILMPLAASVHQANVAQQFLAAGITLLATAGCAWAGARIYRNSILKVGAATGWRQAVAASFGKSLAGSGVDARRGRY